MLRMRGGVAQSFFFVVCGMVGFAYLISRVTSFLGHDGLRAPRQASCERLCPSGSSSNMRYRPLAAAGNSTLGFSAIHYINLPHRYDRLDAASIQVYLSGLKILQTAGVESDTIRDSGMPPTSRPTNLTPSEKGCWRAHANVRVTRYKPIFFTNIKMIKIWSQMLRENIPAAFIMESDATWDTNIRQIMATASHYFSKFVHTSNSTKLSKLALRDIPDATEDDPWQSQHWDIFSFGTCHEFLSDGPVESLVFPDSHAPPGMNFSGRPLNGERAIYKSSGFVCLTGYGISLSGAAKLLLRSALNLDDAVDVLIGKMVLTGDLVAYSIFPPVMGQWTYVNNIGMNQRGANSDIWGSTDNSNHDQDGQSGWEDVTASGSVWKTKDYHENTAFRDMTLQAAWKQIFN